jgi:hypothetical protein
MSRFTTSPIAPVLVAIAALIATSLFLPPTGQAQSIQRERALLNIGALTTSAAVTGQFTASRAIDGEQALLAESPAGPTTGTALADGPPRDRSSVDGERALLGRRRSR